MPFVDLLHNKECWLWCRITCSRDEGFDVERIGESPEDEYELWMHEHYRLFKFDVPHDVWKAHQVEEEKKRGDLGIPEWLYHEMRQEGLAGILSDYVLGYDYRDELPTYARFGLENGIAPYQPFLLRFPMPHYSKHWTDCGYEYDVDYDGVEVMRVVPWPPARVLKQWERFLKDFIA